MPGDVTELLVSGRAETALRSTYIRLLQRVAINRPALSAQEKAGDTLQSTALVHEAI